MRSLIRRITRAECRPWRQGGAWNAAARSPSMDPVALVWLLPAACLIVPPVLICLSGKTRCCDGTQWYDAITDSTGRAPAAEDHPDASVRVYYARSFSWRAPLATHPWIALKRRDATAWTCLQVTAWGGLEISETDPDCFWYSTESSNIALAQPSRAHTPQLGRCLLEAAL